MMAECEAMHDEQPPSEDLQPTHPHHHQAVGTWGEKSAPQKNMEAQLSQQSRSGVKRQRSGAMESFFKVSSPVAFTIIFTVLSFFTCCIHHHLHGTVVLHLLHAPSSSRVLSFFTCCIHHHLHGTVVLHLLHAPSSSRVLSFFTCCMHHHLHGTVVFHLLHAPSSSRVLSFFTCCMHHHLHGTVVLHLLHAPSSSRVLSFFTCCMYPALYSLYMCCSTS